MYSIVYFLRRRIIRHSSFVNRHSLGVFALAFLFYIIIPGPADPLTAGKIVYLGIDAQSFQQSESLGVFGPAAVPVVGLRDLVHGMIGVIQIAESNGSRRTGLGTGGLVLVFLQFPPSLHIGLFLGQLVAMDAKAALLDDPAHTNGHIGIQGFFHSIGPHRIPPVKLPDMIGAGRHTIPAAETAGVNLADDAGIHVVVGGRCRANRHTWRMTVATFTMLAGSRQKTFFGIRKGFSVG